MPAWVHRHRGDINAALDGLSFAPTANYTAGRRCRSRRAIRATRVLADPYGHRHGHITVTAVTTLRSMPCPRPRPRPKTPSCLLERQWNRLRSATWTSAAAQAQITLSVTNGMLTLTAPWSELLDRYRGRRCQHGFTGSVANIMPRSMAWLRPTGKLQTAGLSCSSRPVIRELGSGGTLTDTDTVNITVTAVNDAPVNTVPAAQTTPKTPSLSLERQWQTRFRSATWTSVPPRRQVTLSVTNGHADVNGTSGLSFATGTGAGDASDGVHWHRGEYQCRARWLSFSRRQRTTTAGLSCRSRRAIRANSGAGWTLTDTDTLNITARQSTDAVNTVPAAQTRRRHGPRLLEAGNGQPDFDQRSRHRCRPGADQIERHEWHADLDGHQWSELLDRYRGRRCQHGVHVGTVAISMPRLDG